MDAFASAPFRGGPAYVVEPFEEWPDASLLQRMATRFAQPETAFLRRAGDRFELRWFTPTDEVPLCGHATLAASHVIAQELEEGRSGPIMFECLSGSLSARCTGKRYELDFPADPPRAIAPPEGLSDALGTAPRSVWAGQYLCAMLDSEQQVRAFAPDPPLLESISRDHGCEPGSLVITSFADEGRPYDVVSRFFAPLFGIPEDPVTGSAHCMLMPLYAALTGRNRLSFHQAYPGRGGDLECELAGQRVLLRGEARTMMRGKVELSAFG